MRAMSADTPPDVVSSRTVKFADSFLALWAGPVSRSGLPDPVGSQYSWPSPSGNAVNILSDSPLGNTTAVTAGASSEDEVPSGFTNSSVVLPLRGADAPGKSTAASLKSRQPYRRGIRRWLMGVCSTLYQRRSSDPEGIVALS